MVLELGNARMAENRTMYVSPVLWEDGGIQLETRFESDVKEP